jgi:CBS domain-containing protein
MLAREIMTKNPVTVRVSEKVSHVAGIMRERDIGAVLVVDESPSAGLCGIITDRDIVVRCTSRDHLPECPVSEHMTPTPLQTVHPTDDVADVMAKMERAQVRRIPVVSDTGALVGIIAQADVATKVGNQAPREVEELLAHISAPAHALR